MALFHKDIQSEPYGINESGERKEILAGKDDDLIQDYDLIVVGAGPSGLFCAINSFQKGKRILILEKKNSPGHKLLI
ncbi:MAG TPA: NAD(P)/FAD-dependent oxidoreductase, partial [Methanothrix sp.]|nr:NAD(P)/FAD-dependent oxidoreductase [Methanothrix sp.]